MISMPDYLWVAWRDAVRHAQIYLECAGLVMLTGNGPAPGYTEEYFDKMTNFWVNEAKKIAASDPSHPLFTADYTLSSTSGMFRLVEEEGGDHDYS